MSVSRFPSSFEKELKNGRFVCPECSQCKKIVWPPNERCSICFSKVHWRDMNKIGNIVECSKDYEENMFCIAEFEEGAIRLVGKLENPCFSNSSNQCDYESTNDTTLVKSKIILKECGYKNDSGRPYYVFKKLDDSSS